MLLFVFLITTVLTLDLAKSADISITKAPMIPPQPLEAAKIPNNTMHSDESAAAQYTEGGSTTPKNETKNAVQEVRNVTVKLTAPASVDERKIALTDLLEKEGPSANTSTKARKGVDPVPTTNVQLPNSNESSKNTTTPQIPQKFMPILSANSTTSSTPSIKNATAAANLKPTNNETSTEPVHKKPLILNADESVPVPAERSELKKSDSHLRSSTVSAVSGHPNLVVPVTITVFALPLFAVLGYYALKHGREAWKNRHYRRMDFLLDGMYND